MSLSYFDYQAFDGDGNLQSGQLSAETESEVVSTLKNRKLTPIKIVLATKQHQQAESGKSIARKELIDFTQGLNTLIRAQIPIDKALSLLEGLTDEPATKQLVEGMRRDVNDGKSLAQAMEKRSNIFSKMYISIVHAGEEAGILDQLLPALEKYLVDSEETRRHLIGAMIYPVVLLVAGILSVVLMLGFVVPQFATLFADAGSNTPASAAFLLGLSDWVNSYGWILAVIPFMLIYGWKWWGSEKERRKSRDQFLLKLPLMGSLLNYQEAAAFSRTLGSLLNAGIPLFKGLRISRGVIENLIIHQQLLAVEEDVTAGMPLGKALDKHTGFPVLLPRLVSVGEETGRTAEILNQVADTFDSAIRNSLSKMVALVEPLLILILGILVGGIVITMLSAVFSINDIGV